MSKPVMSIALVCGPDSDMEANAIRATLESFDARVITYWIGRPSDLMDILSGKDLYPDTDVIIFSFHGDEGSFVMPELDESVYEEHEPRDDFGPEEVARFINLPGKIVIANGCSLGDPKLAQAFLNGGCQTYIGPDDYPYGSSALMFVVRYFYEVLHNKKSAQDAFLVAKEMDEELDMYRIYEQSAARELQS